MAEQASHEEWTVLGELEKLALPKGSYMVMGSGILDALSIRKSHDIDLVVNDDVYEKLLADGWNKKVSSDGHHGVESGLMEAYNDWTDSDALVKKVPELLVDAEWVNGVPFNSLAKLALYKARRGQQKDFADLVLINEYLNTQFNNPPIA
ncbi:hypothetical protein H7100_03055 [Candidatus Saccharibacteria bacterium]|nr:hypothetical protein [Candidatus Saccharibacteria bacterium]